MNDLGDVGAGVGDERPCQPSRPGQGDHKESKVNKDKLSSNATGCL